MEQQAAEISWLDAKILEGLRRRVNLLVNKFPFDLVGRRDRPPKELVQDAGNRLEDELRDIDVSAMLDDLLVY